MARDQYTWIQSASGRQLWPLDTIPDDLCLADIAASLSKLNRFLGHTREPFSVAQHSVMASRIIKPELAAWGLMHDAAEALIGDIPRPLKRALHVPGIGGMKYVEERIMRCVATRFGLPMLTEAIHDEISRVDLILLATERRDLMATPLKPWISTENVVPLSEKILPWPCDHAEAMFLERAAELGITE